MAHRSIALWPALRVWVRDELHEGQRVETVYDWITVAIFGGLVVLFLHRSVQPGEPQDTILHYLPPAVGCAFDESSDAHGRECTCAERTR